MRSAGEGEEALQPQDSAQRRRAVAEGDGAAAEQLAFADIELAAQAVDAPARGRRSGSWPRARRGGRRCVPRRSIGGCGFPVRQFVAPAARSQEAHPAPRPTYGRRHPGGPRPSLAGRGSRPWPCRQPARRALDGTGSRPVPVRPTGRTSSLPPPDRRPARCRRAATRRRHRRRGRGRARRRCRPPKRARAGRSGPRPRQRLGTKAAPHRVPPSRHRSTEKTGGPAPSRRWSVVGPPASCPCRDVAPCDAGHPPGPDPCGRQGRVRTLDA